MAKRKRDSSRADRLNVVLPGGVIGRVGQHTITGPNGKLMSKSQAAKLAGISKRTLIARIDRGVPEKEWFHDGNLRYRDQPKRAVVMEVDMPRRSKQPRRFNRGVKKHPKPSGRRGFTPKMAGDVPT